MHKAIIYIPLLDEGTAVWRPTEGEEIGNLIYKVLPTADYSSDDEHWAFPPGTIVNCVYKLLSGSMVLVAVEKV